MTIRAVVAGASAAIRSAFKTVIEGGMDVVVVGEASTGRRLADLWDRLAPDLVLIDSNSKGFEAFRVLGRRHTGVVLISNESCPAISYGEGSSLAIVNASAHVSELTEAIRRAIEAGPAQRLKQPSNSEVDS